MLTVFDSFSFIVSAILGARMLIGFFPGKSRWGLRWPMFTKICFTEWYLKDAAGKDIDVNKCLQPDAPFVGYAEVIRVLMYLNKIGFLASGYCITYYATGMALVSVDAGKISVELSESPCY